MIGCAGSIFTGPKEIGSMKLVTGATGEIPVSVKKSKYPHRYTLALNDVNYMQNSEAWESFRMARKGSFKGKIYAKTLWKEDGFDKFEEYFFEKDVGSGFGGVGIPVGTIAFPSGRISQASVMIEIVNEDTVVTQKFQNLKLSLYEEYGK